MESLSHNSNTLPHTHPLDAGRFVPDRRAFLKLAGFAGVSWLTPLGQLLADQAERTRQPAQSLILIWLAGGPSQLETFDLAWLRHAGIGRSLGSLPRDEIRKCARKLS